jgi:hypothetical protein
VLIKNIAKDEVWTRGDRRNALVFSCLSLGALLIILLYHVSEHLSKNADKPAKW